MPARRVNVSHDEHYHAAGRGHSYVIYGYDMSAMSATSATKRTTRASATAVLAACLSLGAPGTATATAAATGPGARGGPSAADLADAHRAATAPATLESLSRFFAREGSLSWAAADRRVENVDGDVDRDVDVDMDVTVNVPVYTLAPEFVAGKPGAPVAWLEYLAGRAVSSDGRSASVWTARRGVDWQVVGIAAGDDEIRYVRQGARKLPGGRVFRDPQIDAWYVSEGERVLPLDDDARRAVGSHGTTLAAYQRRVRTAYAHGTPAAAPAPAYRGSAVTLASAVSGAGALAALALCGMTALRMRRRT